GDRVPRQADRGAVGTAQDLDAGAGWNPVPHRRAGSGPAERCFRNGVRIGPPRRTLRQVSSMALYPLKFKPRFVEKIWGGRKFESVLGKPLPPGRQIGESWELYDFPPGVVEGSSDWVSAEVAHGPLAGRTLHQLV